MGLEVATVAWISVAISVGATVYTMSQIPDNKSNDSIAGTKVTKNGTQSPRNRVYGTAIVGCTYVYSNVMNRDQSYRLDVFSVGGVGSVRFHNVWIDDVQMFEEHKDDLTDPANASSGIYNSSSMRSRYKKSEGFWMQWRSGQENQVAAQLAIDHSDGEWTVNHRGACVPHIAIVADYSTDQDYVFFSDRYNITALVSGADVFDPRTGKVSGESSNTALAVLDFLMNDYYGMGVTVDYIDMESFNYGATFCEKNDLRINSAIDASAKFADILQDMLACCGGALAIVDGKITFLVEEKVLAPIYELNEDDILKNSLKVSPADSGSYYNVVSTTFKSEINRDNDDDFVIPQNAVNDPRVLADGKIITKSLKMPYARDAFTSEGGIVKHCVKYMTNLVYNKSKFQMSCTFDIDLHEYQDLRPWDVVGLTSEIYGFKRKLFRVQSMKVAANSDRFNIATIHCIEYDHSVYDGSIEGTGSLPRPKPDDSVPAPKNLTFTLSSFVNTGYGLLAWEASCFTPSTAYDIEYKLSSASRWTRLSSAFRGTQFTLTDLKEARYDFRVRTYELFLGSSDWTTITKVNVRPAYVIPEVTGLKVEASTPSFKFTWDDMTNVKVGNMPVSSAPNSSGSTGKLADVFHQYSIQIVVDGVMRYATTTKESTFTLDLEKNKEMMGGQPSRSITFRISIEDRLGNSSVVTELAANNRQIGVAGDVDVTNANGSATVEWAPCFEPDFAGTEVHISTTKGFTPSASTLHATLGKESFYVYPFPDKTTRYMRIAHFDTMGRDGLQYSPEITLTYDGAESAKSVRLISDSQTFHVNKGGVAAPSLIIMSAFTQNVEGSVKWTTSPSISLSSTSNPNERVLKYASIGNHDSVKVTVTVDGVTDTMTICKVRDGHDGQDGNTIYEQYRYGHVITPDASWTAWGADMRTSDIYRQTRRVINNTPQAAGRVHRIAGMDGSNGANGERLFVVYHKNPVNQRPMPPEGAGNTGGWSEESEGANWMSQKLANTIDQPLTFWSFPIQMKGNDGEVDYSQVTEIANDAALKAEQAAIASASASIKASEIRTKTYADGKITEAEAKVIAAADAKAKAAETKAKAYADGVVSEAEKAAIAESQRLAAQAEANAKAASDPKGSASKAQQAAIAAADAKVDAAKVAMEAYADGVASDAEKAAIAAANSKAEAAETRAKAYADGVVTESEEKAISEADRLAKEAEARAKAASDPKGSASTVKGQAEAYARAQANAVEVRVKAYADGIVTEAEEAAIAAADAKAKAAETRAKAYADGIVTTAEQSVIDEAERLAAAAEAKAKSHADSKASQAEANAKAASDPKGSASKVKKDVQNYTNSKVGGIKINPDGSLIGAGGGRVTVSGIGAETPQGAQNKADIAKNTAIDAANAEVVGGVVSVKRPQGGYYSSSASSVSGAIKVRLPQYRSSTMLSFFVDVFDYRTGRSFTVKVSGYNYSDGSWHNCSVNTSGAASSNYRVRFGEADGKSCIYIGETTSTWSYPKIVIRDFCGGHSNYDAPKWKSGWLVTITTASLGNVKATLKSLGGASGGEIVEGHLIKNLSADNITAGKIAAQYVHADVYNGTLVNATNIKAGMLDADHINTRTFTGENAIFDAEVYGGVLTGAVVRTGSTGARAEMREDGYKFAAYNAQNKPTFYVDANGNVVMNSGSISSDVLSEASRNSNIVTWIGTAGKGGNMQFTDNLALQNDVHYFPITNNYYTTGKNGTLNVQYCAANGYLFQDERSAVGAAAPAQKTLPANAAPTVYFVDGSNATKGAVMRMTIKYTTQAANGTAPSKSNPSGTQGWRKTYAHFHIDNIATRPNVAAGTNVKGYKLCIDVGASSIKTALKALNRAPDVISYSEVAEGGRYLPHSYKLVWSGAANSVTNTWGSGLYMVQGHDRGDWHDAGFIFVLDENHYGSTAPRSIFPAYAVFYEYRYDTKIFKSSSGNITRIFKLTGV
ncbi:TPA: fibronectin type III domain-containing protein [Vibrio vulnificus]